MDLPGALNYSQVSQQLGLSSIIDREWKIMFILFPHLQYLLLFFLLFTFSSSNALTGEGIDEGVKWLEQKTQGS